MRMLERKTDGFDIEKEKNAILNSSETNLFQRPILKKTKAKQLISFEF